MAFALRDCPPHTLAKHTLLREYLGGWFPKMASWTNRLIYLDAFAGAGECKGGEDGSPIVALKTLVEHRSWDSMLSERDFVFLLNESHSGCCDHLEECITRVESAHSPWPKNIKIVLENSTFVEATTDLLDGLDASKSNLAPTFAFIDPVGVQHTPMSVLKRLSATPKVEMLVYFAHDAVVRWHAAEEFEEHLGALFGSDEYLQAVPLAGIERQSFLHDLYQRKLREECSYPYIQSFAMYNDGGHLVYYLFFCTRHLDGFDLMKKAMWKVAPDGDFRFRDRYAGYDVLFDQTPDTRSLQAEIAASFAGRTVGIKEVTSWVVANTPFHSSHVKRLTLKPMQQDGRLTAQNQRTPNTYPDDVLLTFPPVAT